MGTLYSAMSVWTYLGKRRNDAYGEGDTQNWLYEAVITPIG